jgi:hypothetical protein
MKNSMKKVYLSTDNPMNGKNLVLMVGETKLDLNKTKLPLLRDQPRAGSEIKPLTQHQGYDNVLPGQDYIALLVGR